MRSFVHTPEARNMTSAIAGAVAGLAAISQLPHEMLTAALGIGLWIIYLGSVRVDAAKTVPLSAPLGFACTRLTLSLIR